MCELAYCLVFLSSSVLRPVIVFVTFAALSCELWNTFCAIVRSGSYIHTPLLCPSWTVSGPCDIIDFNHRDHIGSRRILYCFSRPLVTRTCDALVAQFLCLTLFHLCHYIARTNRKGIL